MWTHDNIRFLLRVYGKASAQGRLDGTRRNNSVYREIADRFKKDLDVTMSTTQIINKLKNLRREYVKAKSNSKSGWTKASIPFYDEIDQIVKRKNVQENHEVDNDKDKSEMYQEKEGSLTAEGEETSKDNESEIDYRMENLMADLPDDADTQDELEYDDDDDEEVPFPAKKTRKSRLEIVLDSMLAKLEERDKAFEECLMRHQTLMQQRNMEWHERIMERQHQQMMQILQVVMQPQRQHHVPCVCHGNISLHDANNHNSTSQTCAPTQPNIPTQPVPILCSLLTQPSVPTHPSTPTQPVVPTQSGSSTQSSGSVKPSTSTVHNIVYQHSLEHQ
ncbi:uncharacterized protein LOC117109407 [Anneissia japonica]|uniref:uncharacterized protein LOC117109407 n=1 Tax=Anneissia japonica TaxID=1529436 RepID=UPI0014258C07|nr:uncharacterized protein LOC117109407 [Anneissia japonica]